MYLHTNVFKLNEIKEDREKSSQKRGESSCSDILCDGKINQFYYHNTCSLQINNNKSTQHYLFVELI